MNKIFCLRQALSAALVYTLLLPTMFFGLPETAAAQIESLASSALLPRVSLTAFGTAATQDFNTLASSNTSSTTPNGWGFVETGANGNGTYTAGSGSDAAGDTYSFGASGNTERAFGGVLSGNVTPTIGAAFTNNTGGMITSLAVAYTGEMWRLGATGRADRLDFQYSTNATDLSTGDWIDINELDFSSPVTSGSVGPLNGNATANRTAKSFTISSLNIPSGANFYFRWNDFNATGADDGLAIDDFSIMPSGAVTPTNPSGTGTAAPSSVAAGGSTLLTVNVTPGTNPASTGLTVRGDLTAIGGSSTQVFYNDGTNGDVTPNDNTFSYAATVAAGTSAGAKSLPITISDAEMRTGTTSISLTVTSNSTPLSASGAASPSTVAAGGSTLLTVTVTPATNPPSTGIAVVANLTSIGGASSQTFFDDGTNGDQSSGDNIFSYQATISAGTSAGAKSLPVTVTDAQSGSANTNIALTVTTGGQTGQPLPFSQNWSNTNLITTNNVWTGVPGIVGYRGDDLTIENGTDPQTILADGASTPLNVTANQSTPNTITSGGIVEFDGLADPVVAFQGSGTADAPHLVISINTTGQDNIVMSYKLRDIDSSDDSVEQPVALQYRIGSTGNYTNIPSAFVADATEGPTEPQPVTPVTVALPAAVNNQPLVQLRIITTNAVGIDEFVGIDDIVINGGGTLPLSAFGFANPSSVQPGGSTLLTVTVTPATNPPSTGITVTGDLSSIGGSATQSFSDNGLNGDATAGDNIFSYQATVAAATSVGAKNLPIIVSDAQTRTVNASISLTVSTTPGEGGGHSAAEHMVMGNPSNATTDINMPTNYLLPKEQYVMSYHRDRAIPNWVSWHLDSTWIGGTNRQDDFRPDPALPAGWYRVTNSSYSNSGFTRGHHTPSGDRTSSIPDNSATFLMTNMMPQSAANNNGPWEKLESASRGLVSAGNELYIVAGGYGSGGTGENGFVTTIDGGRVAVPSYTWKVILVMPVGSNDVTRVTEQTRTIAVIMPNNTSIGADGWQKYLATVDQVEALTGYDFFSNVPIAIQNVIESRLDAASNTSPQTQSGGSFANLDVSDRPNVTLTGNLTISGNLNLGASIINTNGFKITLTSGATVNRISGYVNGQVEKQFNDPNASDFTYPVGSASGYSPVTVDITALGVNPSSLTIRAVEGAHPNAPNAPNALKRYWTLTETGDLTANIVFKYLDSDVPSTLTSESALRLQRFAAGEFTEIPATIDTVSNTATVASVSQFSDWTLFAPVGPSAAGVSISGRVFAADGRAVSGATLTLMDAAGNIRYARTNPFGFYHFEELAAGEFYIIEPRHKLHNFSPRAINAAEDLSGVDFTATAP